MTDPAKDKARGLIGEAAKLGTILAAAGFLAVRAHINGLGLPAHASLTAQAYLEHGGRFVVSLLGHLLLLLVLFYLVGFAFVAVGARWPRLREWALNPLTMACGVLAATMVALHLELLLLDVAGAPGSSGPIAGNSTVMLMLAEALLLFSAAWAVAVTGPRISAGMRGYGRRGLLVVTGAVATMAIVLLPAAFGRVAMMPARMFSVTIATDKMELRGVLLFTDSQSHFLKSQQGTLLEIHRSDVKRLTYDAKVDASVPAIR